MVTNGTNVYYNEHLVEVTSVEEGIRIVETNQAIEFGVPSIGSYRDLITVYKPDNRFGESQKSRINWGAVGSQSPETTQDFVRALNLAIKYAALADTEAGL